MRPSEHQIDRLHRARLRLREHDARMPLAIVAREARWSVGELIRRFAAVFGETPHRYRSRERLALAKSLLATGDRRVTDICMDVGFSSVGSFGAWFARHAGVSPGAYRRRARRLAALPAGSPSSLQPGCMSLLEGALAAALLAPGAISEKRSAVEARRFDASFESEPA